jgi:Zn-dependent protease
VAVLIDFTLSQLVMRVIAVLFVSTLQGFAVAAVAVALGDAGPRHDGRLNINPLQHVDWIGGAVALVFGVGWSRWVTIDPQALKRGRPGFLLLVAAGFLATLLGLAVLKWLRPFVLPLLPDTAAAAAFELVRTTIELGVWFALVGLLPLPPLAGGHLLIAALPKLHGRLDRIVLPLGVLVAVLIATGVITRVLDAPYRFLAGSVLGEQVGF